MTNDKDKLTLKKCIACKRELPLTPKNYYWKRHHRRAKPFPESRCKDCSKAYGKAYRQANRKKLYLIGKKYSTSPRGIYKRLWKYRHGWKVKITLKEFLAWYLLQPRKCCYCGIP